MHGDQHYQLNREYQKDMLRAAQHHHLALETQEPQERGFWNRRLKREYAAYEAETMGLMTSAMNSFLRWISGAFRAPAVPAAIPGDITQTQELTAVK